MGRRISDIIWNFSFQGCVIHLLWPWSHFWRMKMKSLWRKNNEKRSPFVFAKQVTFSRTRKVSTNKDTIKKFSKFASLTTIYYRGYYVGPQSFIRICTEVQFLLKFWRRQYVRIKDRNSWPPQKNDLKREIPSLPNLYNITNINIKAFCIMQNLVTQWFLIKLWCGEKRIRQTF